MIQVTMVRWDFGSWENGALGRREDRGRRENRKTFYVYIWWRGQGREILGWMIPNILISLRDSITESWFVLAVSHTAFFWSPTLYIFYSWIIHSIFYRDYRFHSHIRGILGDDESENEPFDHFDDEPAGDDETEFDEAEGFSENRPLTDTDDELSPLSRMPRIAGRGVRGGRSGATQRGAQSTSNKPGGKTMIRWKSALYM